MDSQGRWSMAAVGAGVFAPGAPSTAPGPVCTLHSTGSCTSSCLAPRHAARAPSCALRTEGTQGGVEGCDRQVNYGVGMAMGRHLLVHSAMAWPECTRFQGRASEPAFLAYPEGARGTPW